MRCLYGSEIVLPQGRSLGGVDHAIPRTTIFAKKMSLQQWYGKISLRAIELQIDSSVTT